MIVLWRVTEKCNLACGFCAYDRRLQGARREVDVATVLRFGQTLGDYRRMTGERVLLSWLGGEPLLWRPVFDTSRRLRQDHGIEISATTNGTTLHLPQTIPGVIDSFSELTISVDGLASFHDQVRGCPGGWQRLRSAVSALVDARERTGSTLKLRANVVLMRDNLAQFPDLCAELASWYVDEITFNQLGGRDRPEFFPAHCLRPQDIQTLRTLLPGLRARLEDRGVQLCASEPYLQRIEASASHRDLPIDNCAPGEQFLFIDEAGRIAPCSFTGDDYGAAIDTIDDARGLLELPSRYRAARAGAPARACANCPSTHVFSKFAV